MNTFDDARVAGRLSRAGELAAQAIELYARGLLATERIALDFLRARLEASTPPGQPTVLAVPPSVSPRVESTQTMSSLLALSLAQDADASKREYYGALVAQLVSDEARIIATLVAGTVAPSVSVYRRRNGDLLLGNASLVGRAAAVTLPSLTTTYVNRLLGLGLVEVGPEDPRDEKGYELLLADKEVRAALKEGELGKVPARLERSTIRISPRGSDLWRIAGPDAESDPCAR